MCSGSAWGGTPHCGRWERGRRNGPRRGTAQRLCGTARGGMCDAIHEKTWGERRPGRPPRSMAARWWGTWRAVQRTTRRPRGRAERPAGESRTGGRRRPPGERRGRICEPHRKVTTGPTRTGFRLYPSGGDPHPGFFLPPPRGGGCLCGHYGVPAQAPPGGSVLAPGAS